MRNCASGSPPYPYVDGELRKVARDAYIDWQGSRYSVPWQHVGKEVWVRELAGEVDVLDGRQRIAMHPRARRKHEVVAFPPHHQGIPLGARRLRFSATQSLRPPFWIACCITR